jgi:class 3 adenylate cyclase
MVAVPARGDEGPLEWVLDVPCPWLDYVDFYVVHADGRIDSSLTGDRRHAPPEQLAERSFAIPLHVTSGEHVSLYLRVQTEGQHLVAPNVWPKPAFQAVTSTNRFWFGAYYGILTVMLLYNVIIYLWIRDRAYLYYVLYLLGVVGISATFCGHLRLYGNDLFATAPEWISTSFTVFFNLAMAAVGLFWIELVQARRHAPRASRIMFALSVMCIGSALLGAWGWFNFSYQLGVGITGFGGCFALAVSLMLARKGVRGAQFYLAAWGLLIPSVIVVYLSYYDVLPSNAFTLNAWFVCICLEATLLSLALADRINSERKATFAAREQALAESANVGRLRGFLPQHVAKLIVESGNIAMLEPQRRQVTVCIIDLRGFTPFSEVAPAEVVMELLREFYSTMGGVVDRHQGTVEYFAGDSMVIFFNAPLEMAKPEEQATLSALEMRATFDVLRKRWMERGYELGLGIGITNGVATIGAIGFSGRSQYTAIGPVTNLAARLCSMAAHGQILTTARVLSAIESIVETRTTGEHSIKGFTQPVEVIQILGMKERSLLAAASRLEAAITNVLEAGSSKQSTAT